MEFVIRDRLSWLRFLGLDLGAPTPDENTIRLFRKKLTRAGALDALFAAFDRQLRDRGYASSLARDTVRFKRTAPPGDIAQI